MKTIWIAAACAALWVSVLPAQDGKGQNSAGQAPTQEQSAKPKRVRLSDEAATAFVAVRQQTKDLRGRRGPERLVALQKIAQRCESIAAEFAAERPAAARAWFEAAEAWRKHGSADKAAVDYGKALDNDDGRYRERCTFQLAQMQRRLEKFDAAIATYRKAAKIAPQSKRAHQSRVWIARCLDSAGKQDEALPAYRAAVDAAVRPRDRVDAGNWLAKALVTRGDLDAATAAITATEKAVQPTIDKGGKGAAGLQRALDKMSAKRALRRARDKATGAAQDAARLEDPQRR